jgi:3-deoxy-7-phosphoheptulonate synthase
MVVVMNERASEAQIDSVISRLIELGMDVHRSSGVTRTVLGVVGAHKIDPELIGILDGVHEVLRISEPYKRASRTFKPEDTVVSIDDVRVGGDEVIVMAGPCSAETEEQVHASAAAVKRAGAKILRGGAFKPRSSPYSFQGLGEEGLKMLRSAADAHNLKLISEVMDISQIELIAKYCDIFQVGARNMQNYTLLRELGHAHRPRCRRRPQDRSRTDRDSRRRPRGAADHRAVQTRQPHVQARRHGRLHRRCPGRRRRGDRHGRPVLR